MARIRHREEGISTSCVVTLARQKSQPHKTNVTSHSSRHAPTVWLSHAEASPASSAARSCEESGKSPCPGPVPSSWVFLSWCGVDWPWLWSGDFPWKLLSLGRDSQLRYHLQNRSGQMDHSLETARHLPPLLPPPGTPAAQGHCCWLCRPQDTHCWPARGPRFYVKFGERRV